MEDHFIREHIEDLLKNIRTQVLVKLIRPYTRVRITFVAKVLLSNVLSGVAGLVSFEVCVWVELKCFDGA